MSPKQKSSLPVRVILLIFGVFLVLTVCTVVAVAPFISYACKVEGQVRAIVVVLPLSLLIVGFVFLWGRGGGMADAFCDHARLFRGALLLLVLLLQFSLQYACGFMSGWDVEVLTARARGVTDLTAYSGYLSAYPNQLFLFGLFCKIAAMATRLNIDSYLLLSISSFVSVDISILFMTEACEKRLGTLPSIKFQLIASLFIGLSPWVMVPYSDTFGLLFVSAIVWSWTCISRRPLSVFSIALFTVLGYKVKPTVVFVTVAIVLLDFVPAALALARRSDGDSTSESARSGFARSGVALVGGILLAVFASQYITGNYVAVNPKVSYGMTHFLAMGVNPEARGVYSEEETRLSSSIADPAERKRAQIELWRKHLDDLGPAGLLRLMVQKNMTTYADGTFAWRQEGTFITKVMGISPAACRFFGITMDPLLGKSLGFSSGEVCFRLSMQSIWLAILMLGALNSFEWAKAARWCDGHCVRFVSAMALSLLMLSGFLLVFECRARYLFLYSLLFVAIAVSDSRSINEGSG